MKRSRKVLIGLLALGMGASLAACGSKKAATDDSGSSAKTSAKSGDDLSGKLVYWSMWNEEEPQGQVWSSIVDGFNKEHPKANVSVQWVGRDNKKVLKPALEGGEQIDVFEYPFEIDLSNYVLDLTDLVDKPYEATDGKNLSDMLTPGLLETPKTLLNLPDITPAVGYKPWLAMFMYNQDVFDKAGVKEEPKTWDELADACAKIKKSGVTPLTFDDAYASWLPGMYLEREKGQEWVQKLVKDSTGEMWKDPAVLEMAQAYQEFADKGYFADNVDGNKYPAGQQDIANGKVGMYYNLSGLTTEVSSITGDDFKWGGFAFPDVADGQNRITENPYGCTALAVNKDTKDSKLAMEFIAYALDKENDEKMVKTAGTTPANKETAWPKSLEGLKPAFDANKTALRTGADIASNSDLAPTIQETFTKLAAGKIDAEKFVSTMVAAAKK